jgi:hypothetical protein
MNGLSNKRGQLSSLDLIVAIVLFISTLFMVFWISAEAELRVWNHETMETTKAKGVDITNLLLKTPGKPEYWERIPNLTAENPSSLGFALEPNVLDEEKLIAFANLSYYNSSRLMGLSKQDYRIEIIDFENKTKYEYGADIETAVSIERMAILGNETVEFIFSISPK